MRVPDKLLRLFFHKPGDPAWRGVRIAQGVCLALLLGSIAYLVLGEHPWEMNIRERLDAGKNLTIDQDMALGFTGAALLTVMVSLVLHQTARWWAAPLGAASPRPRGSRDGGAGPVGRTFWLLVLLAVVLAGALRLPLASKSLWWDEGWTLQRVVLGQWEKDEDDPARMEWVSREWKRAFFYYQKPTNHIPFTVAAKACTHAWQRLAGAPPDAFNEIAFRLPSILAALASVVVIALLARELGFARAGVGAAFLLALHPWHIQYGIDGRSFSFVVLFSMLSLLQLLVALRTARWRNWVAYGLCQFLLLWAFPYALFFSGLLVVGGFAAIAFVRVGGRDRWLMAGRFFACNSLSAIALAFMIGPLVPQLIKWTDAIHGNSMIHAAFLRQLAANLVAGMGWDGGVGQAHFGIPTLDQLPPPILWSVLGMASLLAAAGFLRAARGSVSIGIVLAAAALAAPLALVVAYHDTHYFYTRYVIYALPALILFWAVGADGIGALLAGKSPGVGGFAVLGALTVMATLLWSPRMGLLLERPVSPMRDVARALEKLDASTPGGILAAGFNLGGRKPDAYNRHIRYVDDLDDLERLLDEARETGKPFYVFYGYESFNRVNEPEPFRLLDDPGLFTKLADFHGIEPDFHHQLFLHRPGNRELRTSSRKKRPGTPGSGASASTTMSFQ